MFEVRAVVWLDLEDARFGDCAVIDIDKTVRGGIPGLVVDSRGSGDGKFLLVIMRGGHTVHDRHASAVAAARALRIRNGR